MKRALGFAFLICCHLSTAKELVFRDLFVFRIGGAIYSLERLEKINKNLSSLKCFYPDSLVASYYKDVGSPLSDYFQVDNFKKLNETKRFDRITRSFVGMAKMFRYASSQSVSLSSDLPKALKLSAVKANCSLEGFQGDELSESLRDLVLLEVFLRSRFAPSGSIAEKEKKVILTNIASLEESVRNQLEHENFEN